ncbi:MAG TPA: B12-binding domain-containing radical SAM protein, partial [Thermodesulfovibrionia bacterium]|nr:B12-binding domain-containing radical SAM protein [Thermodesulfovibrionia bacterium]
AAEIGSDAACDVTLQKLGKGFSFHNIVECNNLLVKHGIATSHYFMFGWPGETKQTVFEGIENIKSLKSCVAFIFMGIRILPNTSLARIAIKENILSSDEGMLKPIYYISPSIDKDWLEKTLTESFSKIRHCIFPPDAADNSLRVLHKLGYSGTLWDLLIPGKNTTRKRRHAAE